MDLVKQTTPARLDERIGSYSLWWIINSVTGISTPATKEYLAGQREYLEGLLKQVISQTDEKDVKKPAVLRFLDWPSSENQAAVDAGLQAMTIMALDAGAQLCSLLGDDSLAKECAQTAVKARKAASVLARSLLKTKSEPYTPGNKTGRGPSGHVRVMPAKRRCRTVYFTWRRKGFSTFYGYYMLDALAMAGQFDTAMDIMRTYWGGMLSVGATILGGLRHSMAQNAARIDSPVPASQKVYRRLRAYCYTGFPPQSVSRMGIGTDIVVIALGAGVRPLEAGFAAGGNRTTPRQSAMGRRNFPDAVRGYKRAA